MKDFEGLGIRWNKNKPKAYRNLMASKDLIKEATIFQKDSNLPFVAKDIKTLIQEIYKVSLPIHIIRETMKSELSLSYKKGKSRPFNLDLIRQDCLKNLFALRIIKKLNDFSTLINIDETLYSRATKATHSWLLNGEECSVSNI